MKPTLRASPEPNAHRGTYVGKLEDSVEIKGQASAVMTVLIVDDNDVFRSSARAVMQAAGYDVIGEAGDISGAIAQVHALHPDIVLLDIQLPDGDGFTLADQLAIEDQAPTVVLISSRERADYGSRVDDAHAAGFISKVDLSRGTLEALIGHG